MIPITPIPLSKSIIADLGQSVKNLLVPITGLEPALPHSKWIFERGLWVCTTIAATRPRSPPGLPFPQIGFEKLVRVEGLEPPRLAARDFSWSARVELA